MNKSIEKSKAKVIVDFQFNVTKIRDGETTRSLHMDGNYTIEVEQLREIIKTAVASALKGAAESLDEEEEKEENIEE